MLIYLIVASALSLSAVAASARGIEPTSLALLRMLFDVEWHNARHSTPFEKIHCPSPQKLADTVWCDAQGRVTRLNVHATSIGHGPLLPPALLGLTDLLQLELVGLTDVAPSGASALSGLSRLTKLRALTLAHLPDTVRAALLSEEFESLSDLMELHVAELPGLSGTIPTELGALSHLQKLTLFRTSLSGSVPSQLGNLHALLHLYLFENRLGGTLPTELNQLKELVECRLQRSTDREKNRYSCPLPVLPAVCRKSAAFDVECHEEYHNEL